MSANIQTVIARANWVATEAQVENLAAAGYSVDAQGELINVTYLRILVVDVQSQVGTKRRGRQPTAGSQLAVIDRSHERFYAAALRGVTTPDIQVEEGLEPAERSRRALERNRRSTRYRSAKTTLVNYVRGGGDIRMLVPAEVTKAALRAAVSPPESTDKGERQIDRAQGALLRAVARRARGDPEGARERLEGVIDALQAALDALPVERQRDMGATTATGIRPPPPRDRGAQRTRVGVPQMHRGG